MVQLKELTGTTEITNPVLRNMVNFTDESKLHFLYAVVKDGVQKGIMVGLKDEEMELQMVYFGSHYLLESALPMYKEALKEKVAHLG